MSAMKPACARCGVVHPSDAARAVGRFNPSGPTGYRADVPGAVLRHSRDAAVTDWCDHQRRSRTKTLRQYHDKPHTDEMTILGQLAAIDPTVILFERDVLNGSGRVVATDYQVSADAALMIAAELAAVEHDGGAPWR